MSLSKTNRLYYRAILAGTFYVTMLQSSMLMAASFEKSEDPIPTAIPRLPLFGGIALPGMAHRGASSTNVAALNPPEDPIANGGAGVGPSDAASVLSDHPSDDETFRGWIEEARSVGLDSDNDVKKIIRGNRTQKKLDIAAAKQAELDARRAAFLAKIGEPSRAKEELGCAASAAAGGGASSATASAAAPRVEVLPAAAAAIAVEHEDVYQKFLGGRLEYRPDPYSDDGLITFPIRDLLAPLAGTADPLSGTFDLSRCGNAGKHISIHTGYKKAKIPANTHKLEIWICPKFLAERDRATTATYLAPIMDKWEAPVGYFWTWGGWDVKADNYDHLLRMHSDDGKNLYQHWTEVAPTRSSRRADPPSRSWPLLPGNMIFCWPPVSYDDLMTHAELAAQGFSHHCA